EHGLVGYIGQVVRGIVGDQVYNIIEPIFDELGVVEDRFVELISRPPPESAWDFFSWGLDVIGDILGLSWDGIRATARAIGSIWNRLQTHGPALVNYLVQQGKLGVKRHLYWYWFFGTHEFLAATEYKIHVGGFSRYFKEEGMLNNPESA